MSCRRLYFYIVKYSLRLDIWAEKKFKIILIAYLGPQWLYPLSERRQSNSGGSDDAINRQLLTERMVY